MLTDDQTKRLSIELMTASWRYTKSVRPKGQFVEYFSRLKSYANIRFFQTIIKSKSVKEIVGIDGMDKFDIIWRDYLVP